MAALGLAHLKGVEVLDAGVHYLVIPGLTNYRDEFNGTKERLEKHRVKYTTYPEFPSNPECVAQEAKQKSEFEAAAKARLALLDKMNLSTYYTILLKRSAQMSKVKTPANNKAVVAINELVGALNKAELEFGSSADANYQESKKAFRTACMAAIDKAKPALLEHRGSGAFFAKLLSALASLFTLGMVNAATNKGFFSVVAPSKTKSAQKVEKIQEIVNTMKVEQTPEQDLAAAPAPR
jgi:hypothetical protein